MAAVGPATLAVLCKPRSAISCYVILLTTKVASQTMVWVCVVFVWLVVFVIVVCVVFGMSALVAIVAVA